MITSTNEVFKVKGPIFVIGIIMSSTFRVKLLPMEPAGWLRAKSFFETPFLSIKTAANESPIDIATAVLAVGAKLSGQASLSTLASKIKSQLDPRVEDGSPIIPIQ